MHAKRAYTAVNTVAGWPAVPPSASGSTLELGSGLMSQDKGLCTHVCTDFPGHSFRSPQVKMFRLFCDLRA